MIDVNDIEVIELLEICHKDFPLALDAYISKAAWTATGEYLNEKELEELNSDDSIVHYFHMRLLHGIKKD